MLCNSGEPFCMHWNLFTEVPKYGPLLHWQCTLHCVLLPPPVLTLGHLDGCEYEIQPPWVRLRESESYTSKGGMCDFKLGAFADLRSWVHKPNDKTVTLCVKGKRGGVLWGWVGADWVGQVVWLGTGMQGTQRGSMFSPTWCYMCCFSLACCGMFRRQNWAS